MAKSVTPEPSQSVLRRAMPLLLIAGTLSGGTYWAWSRQSARIEAEGHYRIGSGDIRTTPRPEWITTDVAAESLRDASLDPPFSSLDPALAERVAKAFEVHPWVAEVRQVRALTGALEVDLVYRRPVCMVELPPNNGKRGLYAVDAEGTLLPSRDFLDEPKKAIAYPRLGGFVPAEVARVGAKWPDARIVAGARTAFVLTEVWSKLKLAKIAPETTADAASSVPTFELLTQEGSRIVWGAAPGSEAKGEMPAAKKIGALLDYIADHGSLDGRDGPQHLDVRGGHLIVIAKLPPNTKTDDATSAKKSKSTEQK